jgi:transglutaminase-like putative cysteine protease
MRRLRIRLQMLLGQYVNQQSDRRMMWKACSLACAVFVGVSQASQADARLVEDSDLISLVESLRLHYKVRRDGTYEVLEESTTKILSEAARDSLSVRVINFNARSNRVEILSAETIHPDGSRHRVSPSQIETKEVGDSLAFDATKQVIISFPKVTVGSRLHLKYRNRLNETAFLGFFSGAVVASQEAIDSVRVEYESELPLYVKVHDPIQAFRVSQENKRGGTKLVIESTKPQRFGTTQEDAAFLRAGRLPRVLVSSAANWDGFAADVIKEQERELAKSLPPLFEGIRAKIASLPPAERLVNLQAAVTEEIRYFGDWRRRNGGHVPRSLQEIAETRYGDCKDMSLVIVAIARKLGLQADLAWVWRSEVDIDDYYYELPTDFSFNHAIARVEQVASSPGAPSEVAWLDATNSVALPNLTLADIAGRPVLVAKASGAVWDKTPAMRVEDAVANTDLKYQFLPDQSIEIEGEALHRGRFAANVETQILFKPPAEYEYEIARDIGRYEHMLGYQVEIPKKQNRVVRENRIKAKVKIREIGLVTSAGYGFPIFRDDVVGLLTVDAENRFSDLWIGTPRWIRTTYELRDVRRVGQKDLGCEMKTPFAELKRSLRAKSRSIEIIDEIKVLQSIVPNEEFQKAEFRETQRKLRQCFNRSAVIIELFSKAKR